MRTNHPMKSRRRRGLQSPEVVYGYSDVNGYRLQQLASRLRKDPGGLYNITVRSDVILIVQIMERDTVLDSAAQRQ